MNLTTGSFLGLTFMMLGAIIATGYDHNDNPYSLRYSGIAIILILKGVFSIVDDIQWHNTYIKKILSFFFSI